MAVVSAVLSEAGLVSAVNMKGRCVLLETVADKSSTPLCCEEEAHRDIYADGQTFGADV